MLRTTPLLVHLILGCTLLLAEKKTIATYYTSSYLAIERPEPVRFKRVALVFVITSLTIPSLLISGSKYLLGILRIEEGQPSLALYLTLSGVVYGGVLYGSFYIMVQSTSSLLYGIIRFLVVVLLSEGISIFLNKLLGDPLEIKKQQQELEKIKTCITSTLNGRTEIKNLNGLNRRYARHATVLNLIRYFLPILRACMALYAYGFKHKKK